MRCLLALQRGTMQDEETRDPLQAHKEMDADVRKVRKLKQRKSEIPARKPVPKVASTAPNFTGIAVIDNAFQEISLRDFLGNYFLLFFYPTNFTYVCPSELTALSDRISEFKDLGVGVVACAPDSQYGHQAFISAPREAGGLGGLSFPLLADFNRQICRDYGVLVEAQGIALRAQFLIDGKGIIRHMSVNDLSVGRNVDEILRIIKAFQFYDQYGDVCPVNWKPGDKTIPKDRVKAIEYFDKKYT